MLIFLCLIETIASISSSRPALMHSSHHFASSNTEDVKGKKIKLIVKKNIRVIIFFVAVSESEFIGKE